VWSCQVRGGDPTEQHEISLRRRSSTWRPFGLDRVAISRRGKACAQTNMWIDVSGLNMMSYDFFLAKLLKMLRHVGSNLDEILSV
jgi:hypothetical protein